MRTVRSLRELLLDGLLEGLVAHHVVAPLRHARLGRLPEHLAELHPRRRRPTGALRDGQERRGSLPGFEMNQRE